MWYHGLQCNLNLITLWGFVIALGLASWKYKPHSCNEPQIPWQAMIKTKSKASKSNFLSQLSLVCREVKGNRLLAAGCVGGGKFKILKETSLQTRLLKQVLLACVYTTVLCSNKYICFLVHRGQWSAFIWLLQTCPGLPTNVQSNPKMYQNAFVVL